MMKSKLFFTGILSLALIFGTILAGCDNGGGGGNGGASSPEITGFSFTQSGGLQEGAAAAAAGAVAGAFGSETGGTAPFTYSLATGDGDTDNGLFAINGTDLKVGTAALTAGNKSIRVEVKDANNKTLAKAITVTVTQAAPPDEITGFSFTQTGGLQEGAAAAAAGAVAGTFGSEVGGTAPFTYLLAAGDGDTDNALFTIDSTNLKVGTAALTAGNKSIRVEVKDKNDKTFAKAITVTVTQAANTGPTVTLLQDNARFIVNWTAVEGATGYQVVWARSTEVPATLNNTNSFDVSSPTTLSYTVRNAINNGSEYSVWVRAKKGENAYSEYSERKSVTPQDQADQKPGKPTARVSPTDDGQLKIEWEEVQWAKNYRVLVSETSSITSAANNVVTQANFTDLTITTGADNAQITLPLQGITNLQYYVWVVAVNGNQETESDPVTGTIIDAPADKAAFVNTTWKSALGTYTFSATQVVYNSVAGSPEGAGSYDYAKPTLTLTITPATAGQHPEWNQMGPITVSGKTFTISNVIFTRQ